VPRSLAERHEPAFVNPPTMKKIGMTWRTHVRRCVHVAISSRLRPVNSPSSKARTAINQCPTTTTRIDAIRRRSA
jgi:hypothetical protein